MNRVIVQEVATQPGVSRYRLAGQLTDAAVARVARTLRPRLQLPGDLLLDLRELTCADGSVILLFYDLADQLAGRGRLYLLFPQDSVRRLVEAFGLEGELLNLRLVRHPAGQLRTAQAPAQAPAQAAAQAAAASGPAPARSHIRLLRRPAFPMPAGSVARHRRVHRLPLRWQPE